MAFLPLLLVSFTAIEESALATVVASTARQCLLLVTPLNYSDIRLQVVR